MGIADVIASSQAGTLVHAAAEGLLHGHVRAEKARDGWCRPWRLSDEQVRMLGSASAWHPGLYRQMARCTSGIVLEFTTDASEVAVEVRLDDEPAGTAAQLRLVDGDDPAARLPHDGLSALVDGHHLEARMPQDGFACFVLSGADDLPEDDLIYLPGLGPEHHVRIYLPCLRGCVVRDVWCDGTYVRPVDARPQMLVLGDSISQGFVVGDPALAWPAVLANERGLDLVNQGVGGQVAQPGTLRGIASHVDPALIVVALGANYRFEACSIRAVARDIRQYLIDVARLWPDVPAFVVSPIWHNEEALPSHAMSCYESVPMLLRAQASVHDSMVYVDGSGLLDADAALLADGMDHPNAAGNEQLARRLRVALTPGPLDAAERREAALALCEQVGAPALPVAQTLTRGLGEVVFVRDGVLLVRVEDGPQLLLTKDMGLGVDVAHALMEKGTSTHVFGHGAEAQIARTLGLGTILPYGVASYRGKRPITVSGDAADVEVQPLDASFAAVIKQRAPQRLLMTDEQLVALLDEGRFLGCFEGEELVGFVGEDLLGAIDMLFVTPGFRHHGIGSALEAAKVNEHLARGLVPWGHVPVTCKAATKLQKHLGLSVRAAKESSLLL